MRKQGYRDSTVEASVRVLKSVARRANLLNPESVKGYLATAKLSEGRKELIVLDLARFHAYKQMHFDKPHYRRIETLPFIPLEAEVDHRSAQADVACRSRS